MMKSTVQCKNCLPEEWWGNPRVHGFWDVDRDAGIAKCSNCGFERKFVSRRCKRDGKMTKAQEKRVEQIREQVLQNDGYGDKYEYKQFEVKVMEWGDVSVVTEVGRIRDEGTILSIVGRTRRHIFVGPKGGMKLVNPAKWIKDERGNDKKKHIKGYVRGWEALTHVSF